MEKAARLSNTAATLRANDLRVPRYGQQMLYAYWGYRLNLAALVSVALLVIAPCRDMQLALGRGMGPAAQIRRQSGLRHARQLRIDDQDKQGRGLFLRGNMLAGSITAIRVLAIA